MRFKVNIYDYINVLEVNGHWPGLILTLERFQEMYHSYLYII